VTTYRLLKQPTCILVGCSDDVAPPAQTITLYFAVVTVRMSVLQLVTPATLLGIHVPRIFDQNPDYNLFDCIECGFDCDYVYAQQNYAGLPIFRLLKQKS